MNFIPADSFSTGHKVTADIFYLAESANRILKYCGFSLDQGFLKLTILRELPEKWSYFFDNHTLKLYQKLMCKDYGLSIMCHTDFQRKRSTKLLRQHFFCAIIFTYRRFGILELQNRVTKPSYAK